MDSEPFLQPLVQEKLVSNAAQYSNPWRLDFYSLKKHEKVLVRLRREIQRRGEDFLPNICSGAFHYMVLPGTMSVLSGMTRDDFLGRMEKEGKPVLLGFRGEDNDLHTLLYKGHQLRRLSSDLCDMIIPGVCSKLLLFAYCN